ncbi:hypothetical protein [Maribacter hydrothermalis]|uniref:hypothetical protein n=1 Tax=Maribacter hydrothermalis TaxID=1836467 RepID=UPI000941C118|nr:hypothetical protein [Maribacter hydrothermalis]APQ16694.1 hypothetical protein BTR34_04870 [Maribacter hydrothermalis]
MSDKRNETYAYYQKNITETTYYTELGERLLLKYPNAPFTQLYLDEIAIDQKYSNLKNSNSGTFKWILYLLLTFSIFLNIYLFLKHKKFTQSIQNNAIAKLTEQEQNIVEEILKNKTKKKLPQKCLLA